MVGQVRSLDLALVCLRFLKYKKVEKPSRQLDMKVGNTDWRIISIECEQVREMDESPQE